MKNFSRILFVLSILAAAGCAGAPDPEPERAVPPEPAPAETPERALADPARASATELRSIVQRNNFGPEAPEAYAAAETAFTAGEQAYENAPEQAITLYEEASTHYRSVIDQGSRARADQLRAAAHEERDRARSVRAEVAQRDRYNRAQSDLDRAETLLEEESFESSFSSFEDARSGFHTAYTAAREQRERAQRALDQLDSDLVETSGRLERMQQDMEVSND
ncbi:MAG: hypothetical protein EA427_04120 [Spirochaetaceae bacterium]|nr:MAG: hypothetical protein EA427_04120 [Spirochaetaceae bacterium]